MQWCLKSPASPLFTQLFIQAQIKENIKAPCHWPLCRNSPMTSKFLAQMASNVENVSIWCRHHGLHYCMLSRNNVRFVSHSLDTSWILGPKRQDSGVTDLVHSSFWDAGYDMNKDCSTTEDFPLDIIFIYHHVDGFVQERCNSSVLAMELHLSCTKPSLCNNLTVIISTAKLFHMHCEQYCHCHETHI